MKFFLVVPFTCVCRFHLVSVCDLLLQLWGWVFIFHWLEQNLHVLCFANWTLSLLSIRWLFCWHWLALKLCITSFAFEFCFHSRGTWWHQDWVAQWSSLLMGTSGFQLRFVSNKLNSWCPIMKLGMFPSMKNECTNTNCLSFCQLCCLFHQVFAEGNVGCF